MDAIDNLHQRASIPAKNLVEPGPSEEHLDIILRAAVTAPDHKAMRPWRFIVVRGSARQQLGDIYAEAATLREPGISEADIERQRSKPMRSPLLIVVAAKITPGNPKVPEVEQLLSAGAAAEHIQLAAHALGYGSVWVTGANAFDDHIKGALRLETGDAIVGFIHIGTANIPPPAVNRPDPQRFVEYWQP